VDEALLTFFGWMSEGVTAARSIQAMPESAYKSFELGANNELRPLGGLLSVEDANRPRQNFPVTYVANGYFDLFDVGSMNRQAETLYGGLVRAIATEPIVEVDSRFDLELLRAQVDAHPALEERLFGTST
jgi:CMP-N-acetylneuraminic acid synthetase